MREQIEDKLKKSMATFVEGEQKISQKMIEEGS